MHFLWQYLHPQQRAFLTHIAQIMADFGWQGYLVGGGVRDLYLAHTRNHIITLPDMDLVLDQAPPQALTQLIPLVTALRPGYLPRGGFGRVGPQTGVEPGQYGGD